MGLFDYVKLENGVELPDGDPTDVEFQTKTTSCKLDTYTITSDGLLILSDTTMFNEVFEQYEDVMQIMVTSVHQLHFYSVDNNETRHYMAYFQDGRLTEIEKD